MPILITVKPGDVPAQATTFKRVRQGQLFYAWKHWWIKTSAQGALIADRQDETKQRFKSAARVLVLVSTLNLAASDSPVESLEQFLKRCAGKA